MNKKLIPWDKAIQAYKKLIQIAPDNPEGY
jgi:hypothetical protein